MDESSRLEEASKAKRKTFPGITRVVVEIFHETDKRDHIFLVADGVAFAEYPAKDEVTEAVKIALNTAIGKYQTQLEIQHLLKQKQAEPEKQREVTGENHKEIATIDDNLPIMYKRRGYTRRGKGTGRKRGRPRKYPIEESSVTTESTQVTEAGG